MSNETKAEELWKDRALGFVTADQREMINPEFWPDTNGLWIPGLTVANAWEFICGTIPATQWAKKLESYPAGLNQPMDNLETWARALLATLPKEESAPSSQS